MRKAGGSLVMTIPKAYVGRNGLGEGPQVDLHLHGKKLIVEARKRPHYKLTDLMSQMQDGLPCVDGWDEIPAVGREAD